MPSPPKTLCRNATADTDLPSDAHLTARVEARRQAHSSSNHQKYIDASRKVSTAHIRNVSGVPTRTNSLKR